MNTLAVDVNNLHKAYGSNKVLDGVSLAVREGEILALLGPNGAGKTTTVEILEGLTKADSGTVRVLGQDPSTAPSSWRSRIGVVLQEATDAAQLTVRETLTHFRSYYPRALPVAEVMALVGLQGLGDQVVSRLSGGQRRRLDVALALHGHPDLVFLDEPTTGFDPEARREFWELIAGMRAAGTSILITTHYMEEAAYLADRVAVMVSGRIIAEGTPGQVAERHGQGTLLRWTDRHGSHSMATRQPDADIAALRARCDDVANLRVQEPTLEDVYLDLVKEARL